MPDIGDTKAGGSTGLKDGASTRGSTSGNTSGVGGGGGGGGGSTGTRGSSTGGVGAGNGSNAPGNSGGGGQNSGVGRDSSRGLGQGAGGAAIGRTSSPTGNGGQGAPGSSPASAGGLRGAGGNYGPGSGRPSTASVSQPSGYRTPNNPTGGQITAPARTTPSAGALGSVGGWNARMGANPTAAPSAVTAQNPSPVTYRGPQQQPSYDPLSGVTQAPRYTMAQELGYAARDAWGNISNAASSVMGAMPDISFSLDGTTAPQSLGLGRFAGVPTAPRAPAPAPGIGPGGFAMPAAAPQPTSYGTGVPAPQTISGALSSVPGLTYGNPISTDPRASMQRALEGYQAERAAVDDAISRGTTLANAQNPSTAYGGPPLSGGEYPAHDIYGTPVQNQQAPTAPADYANMLAAGMSPYTTGPRAMSDALQANPTVDDYSGFTINNGIENASMNLALGSSYPVAKDQSRVPSVGVAGQPTMTPASAPPTPMGTPSGFMSPEVKRATQYGADTLYSPKALDNLYSDINAYDIGDLDRRIAAQQALLGQTIDASQYGGVVSANYNDRIKTPTSPANAVDDPFNDDVALHWTGNEYDPKNVGPDGFGYSVNIDDEGNINYNRNFKPDGTMVGTNHIAGQNPEYIGISSQGTEPNSLQRDAAAALGGNWFNKSANVSTHGYEAGTRIDNGDRPISEITRADGTIADKDRREGTALAAAFAGVQDPGASWSPVSLADSRPTSSYKSYSPVSGLATIARQTPPTSQMTPASGYSYDGSYGPQREKRYYSTPSRGTVPEGWGMTLNEAYSNEGPARTGLYPGRGDVNLGGYVTQDKPSFAQLDNRMTSAEGFDPTGIYGPHLSVAQYPAEDIYGEPVPNQSTPYSGYVNFNVPEKLRNDALTGSFVAQTEAEKRMENMTPAPVSITEPRWEQSTYTGLPALDDSSMSYPGADGVTNEDMGGVFDVAGDVPEPFGEVYNPKDYYFDSKDTTVPSWNQGVYTGPEDITSAGDETPSSDPQHPIYGGDYGDIQMPEKPRAYKAGKAIAGAVTQGLGSAFLTGLEKLGDFEWSRMSAEERLALIDKWNSQNADYVRNRTDGRGGKAELTDRLFSNSRSGSATGRGTRNSNDDGSDAIPPPQVSDLSREYLGPTDPYSYGFGPEYTYYGT